MGQLVKLQDYISRYETDIYKYPGQFIRLKKDQYERLVARWEQEQQGVFTGEPDLENHAEKEPSFFKRFFQRKEEVDDPEDEDEVMALPEREEDVKQFFLDQVFDTQLIWASSTLQEVSYFDKGYERDPWLKYFLQRFPDTYLVFYQPSFKLKNATLDAEVIMLTPTEVMCVSILDRDYQDAVFYPSDDRKWTVMKDEQEKSIVNPVIKLKRMEKLVQSIFDYYEVDFPIKKYLLAQQNQIVHQSLPFQTEYIDQTNYPEWFHKQRESKYPIKAQQLKACEKMLEHTLRHYVKRPVWLDDDVELVLRSHDMYVLIINPVAGRGKGIKIVKEYLKGVQNPQNYKSYYTEYPGHATKLVAQVVSLHEEKIEMLVVVGGDGTFYEVINGVKAYGDLPLAFVPVGSGNDFARGCSMPLDPKESLRTIFKQKRFQSYWAGTYLTDGRPARLEKLFASSLGIGFDAEVAERTNESKWKAWFNRIHLSF